MRYRDLHVAFLKLNPADHDKFERVDGIAEADGILFRCPVCEGKGWRGHHVICWQPSVPQSVRPSPGRWSLVGTGLADLSLVADSSSVHLQGAKCDAHFFIRGGCVTMA